MKKLGFGCMRLPILDKNDQTKFDYVQINKMFDYFIENGFTYFDTAYVYHNGQSENACKQCLVERHKRNEFLLADKLPIWVLKSKKHRDEVFEEQLQKCGVDYFDYYLLHSLKRQNINICDDLDCYEFGLQKKKEGKIKNFGLSFHDDPALLEEILKKYKNIDFVQLQINYLDWLDNSIASKKCYDLAVKYKKPVIVMEPLKGGHLTKLPMEAEKMMKEYNPSLSLASWAIRYAASLDNVFMVLSGMSNLEQVKDNVSYMKSFKPLNNEEKKIIDKVVDLCNSQKLINCTSCRYCTEGCPKKIAIPEVFQLYNSVMRTNKDSNDAKTNFSSQWVYYQNLMTKYGNPKDCIVCLKCSTNCPQHLDIPKLLKEVDEMFDKISLPSATVSKEQFTK